jgi:3-(3-hydroxy-phenyl)propionate hydroxylase
VKTISMEDESVAILIVGAGPTGLTIANLLGQYNMNVLLIERNDGLCSFPRAITIDDEGLRICQALRLHEAVLEHVRLDLGALYLSHEKRLVYVKPNSQRNGYPLISTFDQPHLEAILLNGLKRFPHVEVRFGCTLETFTQTEHGVCATICTNTGEQKQIASSYLLACDGGKSTIRQALGISMRGRTFPQRWLVVDSYDKDDIPSHYITFFCNPARPMVSVPAPDKGRRWEFMLHLDEDEEHTLMPTTMRKFIQQVGGPPEAQIVRQAIYTFHAARARSFAHKHVFLLGDAAHLLPPFGGQGMNCGLRDAHNLAWKLMLVLRRQAQPGILATYQQEREPHAARLIRFSAFMGRMVMPTNRFFAHVRDIVLHVLMQIPPAALSLTEMRVKPSSRYKRGLILSGRDKISRVLAGELLPQPSVLTQDGKTVLLDEVLAAGFVLLRLYSDPTTAFTLLQAKLWHELGTHFICIVPTVEQMPDPTQNVTGTYIVDSQQQLARFLHNRRDLFVFVRPDRYVLGTFHVNREAAFLASLQKLLSTKDR